MADRVARMVRRAWLAYWRPWRVCFALGSVSGMAAMYAVDHPHATLRTVGGFLAALGIFPWIAMLVSSRAASTPPATVEGDRA